MKTIYVNESLFVCFHNYNLSKFALRPLDTKNGKEI